MMIKYTLNILNDFHVNCCAFEPQALTKIELGYKDRQ